MSNAPYLLQEALQALNFMASGGGLQHPLLPPPVHSPLHPLHSPGHFPGLSSLHKPHMPQTSTSAPSYNGEYRNYYLSQEMTEKTIQAVSDKHWQQCN